MSDIVIRAEGLGKRYLIGHRAERERYTALRDVIARGARGLVRSAAGLLRGRPLVAGGTVEEFWALKDVSFEVKRGEVVGIIGRNGAGKSTLLKILSRITEPSAGRVTIRGRVASLLEVGTGFHPELTGRENIYLNGAILGMTRAEIRRRFDEIVAFAEVERFLDTPVKRYSSGMYVRLAFAVAAHLEPEILLVDEVLAVGDVEFQRKCLGKMGEVASGGRTVLFVSHNMGAMQQLCETAIWLEDGFLNEHNSVATILSRYLQNIDCHRPIILGAKNRPSNPLLTLQSVRFGPAGRPTHGEPLEIEIELYAQAAARSIVLGIGFNSANGARLLSCDSDLVRPTLYEFTHPGRYSVLVRIPSLPLSPEHYTVDVGCRTHAGVMIDEAKSIGVIDVAPGPTTPANLYRPYATVCHPGQWDEPVAIAAHPEAVPT